MKKTPQPPEKNKWIVFVSLPAQIGGIIYLFYTLGAWADQYWHVPGEWGMKSGTLLGVFLAMYQVINEVQKINKNE